MYNREELLMICEGAIVDVHKWHDRDSHSSQCGVGAVWALLKANCPFTILTKENCGAGRCITDKDTIWVEISVTDFESFEDGEPLRKRQTYYLPTPERLAQVGNEDWY